MVDQTLVRLLAQVRKYRGAITIAHQHLDELSASSRAGILANTSIKLAGGISAKDASALAPEFRTKAEMLLSFKKDKRFPALPVCSNYTETVMQMNVPLGYAERSARLDAGEYAALLEALREAYGCDPQAPVLEPEAKPEIEVVSPHPVASSAAIASPVCVELEEAEIISEPEIRKEGGGGACHQAICATIKELVKRLAFGLQLRRPSSMVKVELMSFCGKATGQLHLKSV